MKIPRFTYHRPESVDEVLALLAEHEGAKVLAGGQSLLPLMALRLSEPEHLVDIGRVAGLDGIADDDGGVQIGALVRHAQAEDSSHVRRSAPLLAQALPHVGHRAIRNRGTVCGSLAHADPAAELPSVAVAAGAALVVRSVRGERVVDAPSFFEGYLTSSMEPDELLVAVRFPAWSTTAGAAVVELSRRHGDYALVGLAARVDLAGDGTVGACALAYFGVSSVPERVDEAEAALVGRTPSPGVLAEVAAIVADRLRPPDDNHASAAYRKHVAGVLTRRGLAQAVAAADVR